MFHRMFHPRLLCPMTSCLALSLALGMSTPLAAQTASDPGLSVMPAETWVALNVAGIGFSVPQGFEIADDNPEQNLLALTGDGAGGTLRFDAQYRSVSELAAMGETHGADPSDPAAFFTAYGNMPIAVADGADENGHIGDLDGLPLTLLRSTSEGDPRVSIFVAHYPDGAQAWIGMIATGADTAELPVYEAALRQSLSIDVNAAPVVSAVAETPPVEATPDTPTADGPIAEEIAQGELGAPMPEGTAPPAPELISLIGGLVTLVPNENETILVREGNDRRGRITMARNADAPADTMFAAIGFRDNPRRVARMISSGLQEITAYETVTFGGLDMWQIDGLSTSTPEQERVENGDLQPARFLLTHDCLPGAGPLAIGVLMTPERLQDLNGDIASAVDRFAVELPEGSAACSAEYEARLMEMLEGVMAATAANAGGDLALLGQTFTLILADDQVVVEHVERDTRSRALVGFSEGVPNTLFIGRQFDEFGRRLQRQLTSVLVDYHGVSEGLIGDVPVYIVDGLADRGMDQERLPDGQTNPARIYVAQQCANGQSPLTLAVLADRAFAEDAGGMDMVTAGLNARLPANASACPPEMGAFIMNLMTHVADRRAETDAPAPTAEARPNTVSPAAPSPTAPGPVAPSIGKTPIQTVAPDAADWAADWAAAQEDGGIGAMIDFYLAWPMGTHAADARAALSQMGVTVPDIVPTLDADHPEELAWQTARAGATPEAMWDYLKAMPQGYMAETAGTWLHMMLLIEQQDRQMQAQTAPAPPLAPRGK